MARKMMAARPLQAILLIGAAAMPLGGCADGKNKMAGPSLAAPPFTGSTGPGPAQNKGTRGSSSRLASIAAVKPSNFARNTTRLSKAFEKNPADGKTAIQLVYSLRTLGMQAQAANILRKAYAANPKHLTIASEYGRMLLGMGKVTQAKRVLGKVVERGGEDWRTLSALGTIKAREGEYDKATAFFKKAHDKAPKQISVINNLALAMALDGKPDEAENMLRNADDSGRFGARLRQNLALVLALQGKYDEARDMATTDLPADEAEKNIAYLKRMLSTTTAGNGVELTDETQKPQPRNIASQTQSAPATTAAVGKSSPLAGAAKSRKTAGAKAPLALKPPATIALKGSLAQ